MPVSFGAVEARTAAALDKVEREKQEHIADIKLLGAVVAFELKPVLADLVTEIRALISAIKDKRERQAPGPSGRTVKYSIFSRCVHSTAADCRHRLPE